MRLNEANGTDADRGVSGAAFGDTAAPAATLGTLGPVLGLAGLFTVTANNNGAVGAPINALVAAQGLWTIGASTTLPLAHRAMTLKPATGWRFPGSRRP